MLTCKCGSLLSITWTESRKVVKGKEIIITYCNRCGVEFTRTEKPLMEVKL